MATNYKRSIQRGQYPIRIRGSSRCPSHKKHDLVYLCQDCNILICSICSDTSHKTHVNSFLEISKTKTNRKHVLQGFVNNTDKIKIPELMKEISSAKKDFSTCQSKYKTLSDDIKKQRDKCKLDLDKIADDYLAVCVEMERAAKDLLQTHITNLEGKLDTLVKLSIECKQTLQTDTAILIYDTVSEVEDMELNIPQTPNIQIAEYIPGTITHKHMEQAMGKIKEGLASSGQFNLDPIVKPGRSISREPRMSITESDVDGITVISQFPYPDDITSISPTLDGHAWLSDCTNSTIKLITSKGHVLQRIQHNCCVQDISVDPMTGRLWFCCKEERTINEVSPTSTPVTQFTTEGRPDRLCTTRVGRVVVVEEDITNPRIVMYTSDGGVVDANAVEGLGVWSVPSVTYCGITGNVAIVSVNLISGEDNDTDFFRRHIIVYNFTLQPLFHYRGEGIPAGVTSSKFDPLTIVYDSKGNIVIADCTRHTIELVSGAGKYVKTLHTNKGGQGPVGIQADDVLWSRLLGIGTAAIKLFKY